MRLFRSSLLILLSALILLPLLSNGLTTMTKETYYDVLGLDSKTCDLKDIKKAYRKLALLYHPDRVAADKKEESTVKFREVNEAYEVLSDPDKRAEYDRALRFGGQSTSTSNTAGGQSSGYQRNHDAFQQRQQQRRQQHRDPFSQFNDLFSNDPFFKEAMKDMDDLFSKTFQQNQNTAKAQAPQNKKNQGWGGWLLDCLGIEVTTSHTVRNADGTFSKSTYGRSANTYTSKSTRTVIENGRRITIQSMEKDGNRIEERYEGNKLIQRLVNGRPQNIGGRIAGGDL